MPSQEVYEKRKEKLERQRDQAQARLNKLNQQRRAELRKIRTRRLIEHGALAEKYLHAPDMATEDFEKLLARIVSIPQVQELLPAPALADVGQGHQGTPTENEK